MKDNALEPLQDAYKIQHPHSDWIPVSKNAWKTIDWSLLLFEHPEFAPYCPWHRLRGTDWTILLLAQPQFADKCPWSRLKTCFWPLLLIRHPEFADKCPWSKLDSVDWSLLLADQPQFADKCDWAKMRCTVEGPFRDFWWHLFKNQPQFLERIDMDLLDLDSSVPLLARLPESAARFNRWDEIGADAWAHEILPFQPQFADKCNCWDQFDGEAWAALLRRQPQFVAKCNLAEIGPDKWCRILEAMPRLADECKRWDDFTGGQWATLLGNRPHFAKRCRHWDRLSAEDWVELLLLQPRFADRCGKWSEISPKDWWRLLEREPQFLVRCEVEPCFSGDEWVCQWMPRKRPDHHNPRLALPLADKYGWWSRLDGEMWSRLLGERPEFADKCDWNKLRNRDWFNLLDGPHAPGLASHCPETVFAYWRKRGFAFKGHS